LGSTNEGMAARSEVYLVPWLVGGEPLR
jgi:hypothetical protein